MNFIKVVDYMDSLYGKYGLPAADCIVMQEHKILFRHMVGWRDYERRIPSSDHDLYDIYSCTKIITMIACMRLVEKGLLGLDDYVEDYIPQFNTMKVSDDYIPFSLPVKWPTLEDRTHDCSEKITLRQLITMTSGVSADLESSAIQNTISANPNAGTLELVNAIAKMPLLFDPGTRYTYGLGHDVIAAVIEVVSGVRYRDYLQEEIFKPLKLLNMFMQIPEAETGRLSARYGCAVGSEEIKPVYSGNRFRLTANYDSGGAGLACTVDEFIKILDALANGGVAFNGYRLLSQQSIDEIKTPQLSKTAQEDFSRSGKVGYGYGLGVRTLVDSSKSKGPLGEFGWDGAAGSYALIDAQNHLSIFYAQEVLGMIKVYSEIHPTLRDLVYTAIADSK